MAGDFLLEQMNLFQWISESNETKFHLMDRVKVKLIDEKVDSEIHHYRKYYEPHILNKVGKITGIRISEHKVTTYEVDIFGTRFYLLEQELQWIG